MPFAMLAPSDTSLTQTSSPLGLPANSSSHGEPSWRPPELPVDVFASRGPVIPCPWHGAPCRALLFLQLCFTLLLAPGSSPNEAISASPIYPSSSVRVYLCYVPRPQHCLCTILRTTVNNTAERFCPRPAWEPTVRSPVSVSIA
ncbi:hypothetical protein BD311DRAFT_262339 [Dichomitus squalens]|uniref:Uncharacterized protein n=1 Tax=Dichomitus squalens TaxID=114155 RepID=A0A4Q9M352_9APHY|nr:hypothetical protein BD311DRAFT_262339 [Dichomitus squalens]